MNCNSLIKTVITLLAGSLFISCNNQTDKMKFTTNNNDTQIELTINNENDDKLDVSLSIESKIDGFESYSGNFMASNIDPDGLSSLEEFDPSGEFNPVQVFDATLNGKVIYIIIPHEEMEEGNYVGFELRQIDDRSQIDLQEILE